MTTSLLAFAIFTLTAIATEHLLGGPNAADRCAPTIVCESRHIGSALLSAANSSGQVALTLVAAYLLSSAAVSFICARWIKRGHITSIPSACVLRLRDLAADRGGLVLIDGNNIAGRDSPIAALDLRPNVEIRIFNPFAHRGSRLFGYVTDFERLNHRMHNKAIIADNAYRVMLDENEGLMWHTREKGAPAAYSTEPESTFRQRFMSGFIKLLPVEGQL